MYITICKIDGQCKFHASSRAPKPGFWDNAEGEGGEGGGKGLLIHVDVWQNPSHCCNYPPIKIN